ncbi:unnamed protein product [Rhizopus microsporus]
MEGFDDRCFCSTSQSSTTHILEPISRPRCSSSECLRTTVAEERIISESTLKGKIGSSGHSKWSTQAWWPMVLPLAKKNPMVLPKLQQGSTSLIAWRLLITTENRGVIT